MSQQEERDYKFTLLYVFMLEVSHFWYIVFTAKNTNMLLFEDTME